MTKHFKISFIFIGILSLNLFSATTGSAEVSASTKTSQPIIIESLSNETVNGKTTVVKWVKTITNDSQIIQRKTPSENETIIGLKSTKEWTFQDSEKTIKVTTNKSKATVVTTRDNKTTTKNVDLKDTPLLYPPSFFLSPFIQSEDRKLVVWSISKSDGSFRQMILTKLNKETVTINDKTFDCIKVEMKPTGLAGMAWKAYYWFELPSGTFKKYFGKKGPPGTPDYTIEKIN